ncbi:uncharacterized protein LOC106172332 isoform X1 [Lingula anatina]|uniref:Uncharacterized protein LOC106172332 isoform X1 n=1 Tax=Lingula anatina TaxID=7574 RepID=A0A1S3JE34_LINAN|nr:uncharacterized protein LOC106172332 isoform X1 [Lingula anatina]|eukprot:XP_013408431.1 uncharacterized protein LOC106172332 isoform X1 [Lingula anatina]
MILIHRVIGQNTLQHIPMAVRFQTGKRDEQEMRRKLEEEFSSLVNTEAYNKCVTIINNGEEESRKRGLTYFDTICENILNLSELPSTIRIMDFGGGTGTPISAICKTLQALNKDVIVSVEEPHVESLQKYKKCIENLENATVDVAFSGRFQDYFGKSVEELKSIGAYPEEQQDRVLALHSMYHLTRWLDDFCDPQEDIKRAVFVMYTILKPGGMILIQINSGDIAFIWNTAVHCFKICFPNEAVNLTKVAEARSSLLFQGEIAGILNESFPTFKASIWHEEARCDFVIPSLAEVGALVLSTYFHGWADDTSKFDHRILSFCMDFVQREGSKYGLSQEEDGMWRMSNVTHFITIKKVKAD